MKIEKLTQAQEELLVQHREKYLKRGLSCEPINREKSKKAIFRMYEMLGKKEPYYWVCDSPLMCELIMNILNEAKGANLVDNLWANFRDNLRDNLVDNLRDNLRENLGENLWANLRDNLKTKYHGTDFWGQMDNYWIAFYQYPRFYLNIDYGKFTELLDLWDDIGDSCGWWYPYENIVFVSDRPKEINKDDRGRLHTDGKPALLFRDGYCLWMLHGVSVPRYLVETPKESLDIEFFKKEKNADVRAEFIRKFGIERMISLGESIEKWTDASNDWFNRSEYELIDMGKVYERDYAPHLKMKNITTGIYHLEGVHPDCKTIEQAIEYRWKNKKLSQYEIKGIK